MIYIQSLFVVGKYIKYIELKTFFVKQQILVLRMYIDQLLSQFFHLCERCRRIVNKCSAFAGRLYLTAKYTFGLILQLVLFEKSFHMIS